jgi:hypothetical protein
MINFQNLVGVCVVIILSFLAYYFYKKWREVEDVKTD